MASRWVLSRAGILNVYQYGNETLEFAGGRLLLRGVNGSGKSTAMNMLLPFLLEADVRRIDAAGEQSGVLRSWMLADRNEQQPVGYLWLELERDGEHLTIGCGIKANRSTDRVTTWWFVTSRRPGIDFSLVEERVPLSRDALKGLLGADAVFGHDQRRDYRAEVGTRLYGGADIDQYLRLVHIVRSPRVGDRIDRDLAGYLEDALPQLSEGALDDAAQPLEDLEEYRRNVEQLSRTAEVLTSLDVVYRTYARTELHRRAAGVLELVSTYRSDLAAETAALRAQADIEAQARQAGDVVADLGHQRERLEKEIKALEDSEAYREGRNLDDLREFVASLREQVAQAEQRQERARDQRTRARRTVERQQSAADETLEGLAAELSGLNDLAGQLGLTVTAPRVPRIDTESTSPGGEGDLEAVAVPAGPLEPGPVRQELAHVRAAAHTRGEDVGQVRTALTAVDDAERRLSRAEHAAEQAQVAVDRLAEDHQKAVVARRDAVDSWRQDTRAWIARLDDHRTAHGLDPLGVEAVRNEDLPGRLPEITGRLHDTAHHTVSHHQEVRARIEARLTAEREEVQHLDDLLAELRAQELPPPPTAGWQRHDRGVCLAELVDFRDHVGASSRRGLEAAMEAAGLLGAELSPDGSLTLVDGQLVACSGVETARSLSELLVATVPDGAPAGIDADVVAGVLASVSIAPEDLDRGDAAPTVTTDGEFRVGPLRGRHQRTEAEHIGTTARQAALERRRAEVGDRLTAARSVVVASEEELARRDELIGPATALQRSIPSTEPVGVARDRAERAELALDRARSDRDEAGRQQRDAEERHAEAVDAHLRLAATLSLPTDRAGLDALAARLGTVKPACDHLDDQLRNLARAVENWIDAATAWAGAVEHERHERRALDEVATEHEQAAARLATVEDAFGADYQEVKATLAFNRSELEEATRRGKAEADRLRELDIEVGQARNEADNAALRRDASATACVEALPTLRKALAVPGLLAAGLGNDDTGPQEDGARSGTDGSGADRDGPHDGNGSSGKALPAVADTPEGARRLALAVQEAVPAPETGSGPATAEGLRQSLRRRRDAIGAGWDAEDRQPDEALPIHVEVTGPLGRMPLPEAARQARQHLRERDGLLSIKQQQALRNLLEGLVAREVAEKLHAARELVSLMNQRLDSVKTSHGIGVSLRWRRRDDLDEELSETIGLLAKPPDLRTAEEDRALTDALSTRLADARVDDPEAPYRDLIATVMDYRSWHRMDVLVRRPERGEELLRRQTALSEGEKKIVSYLPLFAAVAASCDALVERAPSAPRFVLLDDAFAKVSEDNHAKLFGLLVELDLDFIATSERLWGTHESVPELAITEVVRDADMGVIVLEHARWDGQLQARPA